MFCSGSSCFVFCTSLSEWLSCSIQYAGEVDQYAFCYLLHWAHSTSSWEKPGQVGILTHAGAKWIIFILLKGFCSAYSERTAAHSSTAPQWYSSMHVTWSSACFLNGKALVWVDDITAHLPKQFTTCVASLVLKLGRPLVLRWRSSSFTYRQSTDLESVHFDFSLFPV